jgi:hypothetical protein
MRSLITTLTCALVLQACAVPTFAESSANPSFSDSGPDADQYGSRTDTRSEIASRSQSTLPGRRVFAFSSNFSLLASHAARPIRSSTRGQMKRRP